MNHWYWIGVTAGGLGAACGVSLAALLARNRAGVLAAAALGAAAGVAIRLGFFYRRLSVALREPHRPHVRCRACM